MWKQLPNSQGVTMDSPPGRDWLTVLTNLGVIAGLILVALQMRQTNEALELQSLEARILASEVPTQLWGDWHSDIATSEEVARIWRTGNAGEELSPDETVRYNAMANRYYWNRFTEDKVGTEGSGYTSSDAVPNMVRFATANPGFRYWLEKRVSDAGTSLFATKVRGLLEQEVSSPKASP